ncbi:MAG: hypothetical protein ONA90_05200 [candidate division KSB1 bacterium]|nr:hypothetical protein [candidate division KSB1 bacterium]
MSFSKTVWGVWSTIGFWVSLLGNTPLNARCGMGICPLPVAGGLNELALAGTGVLPSQLALETSYVSFDIGGRGGYIQNALVGVYEHRLLRAGGFLPAIFLTGPQGESTGLGNATLFAELYLLTRPGMRFSFGSQIETPTGNHARGLAADHFMAVPYINLWQQLQNWRFALQTGLQQVIGQHSHGGNTAVLYVNPHTDSEWMARLMASYTWRERLSAEANAHLRQVLDPHALGDKVFLDLGAALRIAIGQIWAVRLGADFPVTSRARMLWQGYASLVVYF